MTVNANLPPRQIVHRWRSDDGDKRDAEGAEAQRLREEGKHVASIGWGNDRKIIEHEASQEPSNQD
jgi:hypothetical protein